MTRTRETTTDAALAATVALAALSWIVAARQMSGMDMGLGTELGSFTFFVAAWIPMMAAMMLPGAVPALARSDSARGLVLFAASYLAVWSLVGVAVYAFYEPHGHGVAAAVAVAAAIYELTPLKRACRRRCRAHVRSGFQFGLYCLGSSAGLMALLLAFGVMNVVWMSAVAAVVVAQKLIPPRLSVDVPLAVALLALGTAVAI
jgi:predicted metal-binding membrane protein